jgi:hypothetical protein
MSDTDVMPEFDLGTVEFEPDEAPKKTRRPRSDKGVPRGTRSTGGTSSAKDKKLAEDLLDPWAKIIKGISFMMPTVAAVMAQRGEKTTTAIVSVASPKMKEALAKASKFGPATDLVETGLMIAIAAMMDAGRIPDGSPIAAFTGVQELFDLTHQNDNEQPTPDAFPAPPGYAPFPGSM